MNLEAHGEQLLQRLKFPYPVVQCSMRIAEQANTVRKQEGCEAPQAHWQLGRTSSPVTRVLSCVCSSSHPRPNPNPVISSPIAQGPSLFIQVTEIGGRGPHPRHWPGNCSSCSLLSDKCRFSIDKGMCDLTFNLAQSS